MAQFDNEWEQYNAWARYTFTTYIDNVITRNWLRRSILGLSSLSTDRERVLCHVSGMLST